MIAPDRASAVQELVGLPQRLANTSTATESSVPVDDIRRVLDLPAPPHHDLTAADRWLHGGAVLRWLVGAFPASASQDDPGDFDFFFPNLSAFNSAGRQLLERGFAFRTFWSLRTMCLLCGRPGQLVRKDAVDDLTFPLPRMDCRECGEFGGNDAASLKPDRLLPMTAELIAGNRIRCLELTSPNGEIIQLCPTPILATPAKIAVLSDLSVSQLALDDQRLYFGPHTWTDILRGRLRLTRNDADGVRLERARKYSRRGFPPYFESAVRLRYYVVRGLLRSLLGRPPIEEER